MLRGNTKVGIEWLARKALEPDLHVPGHVHDTLDRLRLCANASDVDFLGKLLSLEPLPWRGDAPPGE